MAAYRPDVTRISQYEWDISKRPVKTAIFEVQKQGRALSYVRVSNISKMAAWNRKWIWNSVYLSLHIQNSNEIATSMFSTASTRLDWSKHCRESGSVRNLRWRPVAGSGHKITFISAYMRDSNEIPTAIPMFSMSSNTNGLIWTMPCVGVSEQ